MSLYILPVMRLNSYLSRHLPLNYVIVHFTGHVIEFILVTSPHPPPLTSRTFFFTLTILSARSTLVYYLHRLTPRLRAINLCAHF